MPVSFNLILWFPPIPNQPSRVLMPPYRSDGSACVEDKWHCLAYHRLYDHIWPTHSILLDLGGAYKRCLGVAVGDDVEKRIMVCIYIALHPVLKIPLCVAGLEQDIMYSQGNYTLKLTHV